MITLECIRRYKDKNGKIVGYTIKDERGNLRDIDAETLKNYLRHGSAIMLNMKFTSDGRLVPSVPNIADTDEIELSKPINKAQSAKPRQTTQSKQVKSVKQKSNLVKLDEVVNQKMGLQLLKILLEAYKRIGIDILIEDLGVDCETNNHIVDCFMSLGVVHAESVEVSLRFNKRNDTLILETPLKCYTCDRLDNKSTLEIIDVIVSDVIYYSHKHPMKMVPTRYKEAYNFELQLSKEHNLPSRFDECSILTAGYNIIYFKPKDKDVRYIKIPEIVTAIYGNAFENCRRLEVIECPSHLYKGLVYLVNENDWPIQVRRVQGY